MKKKPGSNKLLLLWYAHPRAAIALMLVLINLFIIFLDIILFSVSYIVVHKLGKIIRT